MAQIQSVKGMNDILPSQSILWQEVEMIIRDVVNSYAYSEIRTPILEHTELFKRSIGEVTDIVEKEMYCFSDINGDQLSLRPEGTASTVRAGNQHGLLYNQEQRLWYLGPMFRRERQQKGRYRQFTQFGVEIFGVAGPEIDLEILLMAVRLWKRLGLTDHVLLEINTLGDSAERLIYRSELIKFLEKHKDELDDDSITRMYTNPMRVLDSKSKDTQAVLDKAPKLMDFLGEESKSHFSKLCELLTSLGIKYIHNQKLVRGLDYYNRTVFEWVTTKLGAQGTVLAGGRYDGLVEQLGGKSTPGVGFAMGIERIVLLVEELQTLKNLRAVDFYITNLDVTSNHIGLAEMLRDRLDAKIRMHVGGGNLKKQLQKGFSLGAIAVLTLEGEEVIVRTREESNQTKVTLDNLEDYLCNII